MFSCAPNKELLYGNWYGGAGLKYNMDDGKVRSLQPLPAGNALFVYTEENKFFHTERNTISMYKYMGKTIYYDTDKPDYIRYYKIRKLNNDSMIVYGPFKPNDEPYDPTALYRLSYYRKK
jgi:hypothetical protein